MDRRARSQRIVVRPIIQMPKEGGGLKRFFVEQCIKLVVFSLPLLVAACTVNLSLESWAESNRRVVARYQQESENARQENRLWESLHDELVNETVAFQKAALSVGTAVYTTPDAAARRSLSEQRMVVFNETEFAVERVLARIGSYGRRDRAESALTNQIQVVSQSQAAVRKVLLKHGEALGVFVPYTGASSAASTATDSATERTIEFGNAVAKFNWDSRELQSMVLDPNYEPQPYQPPPSPRPFGAQAGSQ
ncbi:MAG: hypothetical protein ACTS3F_00760 [Phycisphaerales bacterium]